MFNYRVLFFQVFVANVLFINPAYASGLFGNKKISFEQAASKIEPHKAFYDITLVATRSGSPIINISGKMFYEWQSSCEGWITDHRFNLVYEYADGPAMTVTSDFSTFESFDGKSFNFSARRKRNDELYQEYRGYADLNKEGAKAKYSIPEGLVFDLDSKMNFPMRHTIKLIQSALNKEKFFTAAVFDGSDDEGPVEINAFLGKSAKAPSKLDKIDAIDKKLLESPAQKIRMAVFPKDEEEAPSDYEMSLIFHENSVISDMLVDYDDFSVAQKLVALEKIEPVSCK